MDDPPRPARRPSTERRRREILDAALECFAERGYAQATLGEIRARAKASVGSVYHLFASKEEIAGAVYLEGLRAYQEGLTAVVGGEGSAESIVRGAVEHYLGWVEDHEKLARFVANTRQTELVPSVRDELRKMNRAFFRALRDRFTPHVEAGVMRAMPWEIFLVIVIGPAHEHARQWLSGRSRLPPREAAPMLADAAWAGVRASPPPRRTLRPPH